jgi:hypothetical protein
LVVRGAALAAPFCFFTATSGAVQNAENFYGVCWNSIDGEIGKPAENEFTGARLAIASSLFWKLRQGADLAINGKGDAVSRGVIAMLFEIIGNLK